MILNLQCLEQNNLNNNKKYTYKWGKPYDMEKIVNHETIDDACFVAPAKVFCKVCS